MSGAEAIAVVGAIASIVTLIETCAKISGRLTGSNHPSLTSLAGRIDLLGNTLSRLRKLDAAEEDQNDKLKICLQEVASLLLQLEQCISVLHDPASNNVLKVLISRTKTHKTLQHIKELEICLEKWQLALNTDILTRVLKQVESTRAHIMVPPSFNSAMPCNQVRVGTKRQQQKSTCQKGICLCVCHLSSRQQRALIIYAPKNLLIRCKCQIKDISISISALQRIYMVQLTADWTQGLRLNWSLHFRNTVKRTSPGFVVIEKCCYGQLDSEQARELLCTLRNANVIDFTDVTPDGDGMLERAIRRPSGVDRREVQFSLVEFLVREGAPVNSESITPSLFSKWPRMSNVELWPFFRGDPFGLHTISLLTTSDPEFGGTTELQSAVLRNDKSLVEALSKRPDPLLADRNFQGQGILHLAVLNPAMIGYLLTNFRNIGVDAQDDHGTTPLMYAMAYGAEESAKLLLEAGADPFSCAEPNGFCAWTYALVCADDKLLVASLDTFSTLKPELAASAVGYCLYCRMLNQSARSNDFDCKILSYLLQFSIYHDIVSRHGNTLLHLCEPREAELLLQHKAIPVNKKNHRGYTPLMVISRFRVPSLVRSLIERGAIVETVDGYSRNALHHLTSEVVDEFYWGLNPDSLLPVMESGAVLISSGIDLNRGDDCRCPCSSSGCPPLAYFLARSSYDTFQARNLELIPWLLEWFILLHQIRPTEIHAVFLALYRRQRFDELGMTHTCCIRRGFSPFSSERHVYRSPINDESSSTGEEMSDKEDEQANDTIERETDAEEIWDEEKCLAQELQHNCDDASTVACADVETAWISMLARRATMMEEAISRARVKRDARTASARLDRMQQRKDAPKIISELPFRVDYEQDRFVEPDVVFNLDCLLNLDTQLEDCVKQYLAVLEEHPEYMKEVLGDSFNHENWTACRCRLAARLLSEAKRLRGASAEERDWDMNVEEE